MIQKDPLRICGREIRAALLDCDGVVLDTEGQYSRFWGHVGRERFPNVPDFARRIKGQTLVQIKADYFPAPEDVAWIDRRLSAFEDQMDYPYVEGARQFLEALRRRGIPLALITSSDAAKMRHVRASHPEFDARFDCIVTSEDVPRSKPAPDCFLLAARRLGVAPEACLAIEDSPNGLRAARASGALVVALTTTCPASEVAPLADLVVPSLSSPSLCPGL